MAAPLAPMARASTRLRRSPGWTASRRALRALLSMRPHPEEARNAPSRRVNPLALGEPEAGLGLGQLAALPERRDDTRKPRRVVDIEGDAANGRLAGRRREASHRDLGQEAVERFLLLHAEHRIE